MTTLAEHIIVAGAENRPPMLEKLMYDSWASHLRLFIKGKKHGRMMFDSLDSPLVYPTVEENGQTRPNKYSELTEALQLQNDCDVQATNIILHGLPPDVYALVNHQESAKDIWDIVKMLMKANSPTLYNPSQSPQHSDLGISEAPVAQQTITQNSAFQTDDLDAYDSDCDDLSSAKAVLMANLSRCDPEVLSESLKKESKYIDKEIVLEKQNKELENIICKFYRSTQAMHMLTKPQVFYDDTHKQALGYQNLIHLKKAQRIQPTLYDGSVIAIEHAVIYVIDDEETLILEEESQSKMLDK
nr:hypothetical protein [Tanacetum cinerariifolium]GEX03131.1 hypothetical protein [Tanacetum cinerariifolium]